MAAAPAAQAHCTHLQLPFELALTLFQLRHILVATIECTRDLKNNGATDGDQEQCHEAWRGCQATAIWGLGVSRAVDVEGSADLS